MAQTLTVGGVQDLAIVNGILDEEGNFLLDAHDSALASEILEVGLRLLLLCARPQRKTISEASTAPKLQTKIAES